VDVITRYADPKPSAAVREAWVKHRALRSGVFVRVIRRPYPISIIPVRYSPRSLLLPPRLRLRLHLLPGLSLLNECGLVATTR
jgi:hypothetical protein